MGEKLSGHKLKKKTFEEPEGFEMVNWCQLHFTFTLEQKIWNTLFKKKEEEKKIVHGI